MAKSTFRRQPVQTDVDFGDLNGGFLTINNFAGLCDNRNDININQESFALCQNVYIDTNGVLTSRPPLKFASNEGYIIDEWVFNGYRLRLQRVLVSKEDGTRIDNPDDYLINNCNFLFILRCVNADVLDTDENYGRYSAIIWTVDAASLGWDYVPKVTPVQMEDKIYFWFAGISYVCFNTSGILGEDGITRYYFEDAHKYVYLPVHQLVINGIETELETLNFLTGSYIKRYNYSALSSVNFASLIGKKISVNLNNSSTQNTSKHLYDISANSINFDKMLIYPYSEVGSEYNISMVNTPRGNVFLRYLLNSKLIEVSFNGILYRSLPILKDITSEPLLTQDGLYVVAFLEKQMAKCKLVAQESEDFITDSSQFVWEYQNYEAAGIISEAYGYFETIENYCLFYSNSGGVYCEVSALHGTEDRITWTDKAPAEIDEARSVGKVFYRYITPTVENDTVGPAVGIIAESGNFYIAFLHTNEESITWNSYRVIPEQIEYNDTVYTFANLNNGIKSTDIVLFTDNNSSNSDITGNIVFGCTYVNGETAIYRDIYYGFEVKISDKLEFEEFPINVQASSIFPSVSAIAYDDTSILVAVDTDNGERRYYSFNTDTKQFTSIGSDKIATHDSDTVLFPILTRLRYVVSVYGGSLCNVGSEYTNGYVENGSSDDGSIYRPYNNELEQQNTNFASGAEGVAIPLGKDSDRVLYIANDSITSTTYWSGNGYYTDLYDNKGDEWKEIHIMDINTSTVHVQLGILGGVSKNPTSSYGNEAIIVIHYDSGYKMHRVEVSNDEVPEITITDIDFDFKDIIPSDYHWIISNDNTTVYLFPKSVGMENNKIYAFDYANPALYEIGELPSGVQALPAVTLANTSTASNVFFAFTYAKDRKNIASGAGYYIRLPGNADVSTGVTTEIHRRSMYFKFSTQVRNMCLTDTYLWYGDETIDVFLNNEDMYPLFCNETGVWYNIDGTLWTSEMNDDSIIELDEYVNVTWENDCYVAELNKSVPDYANTLNAYFLSFVEYKTGYNLLEITSTRRDEDKLFSENGTDLLIYLPKSNEQKFSGKITNLHPIAETAMGVFTEEAIWYISSVSTDLGVGYTAPVKSKIPMGCRDGCEVVTALDGQVIVFATPRGIASMTPQDFIASTERTLVYMTDNIQSKYDKYYNEKVRSAALMLEENDEGYIAQVKVTTYKYWLLFNRYMDNEILAFDTRNSSWWVWKTPYPIRKLIVTSRLEAIMQIDFNPIERYGYVHELKQSPQMGVPFLWSDDESDMHYDEDNFPTLVYVPVANEKYYDDTIAGALNGDYERIYENKAYGDRLVLHYAEPTIEWFITSQRLHFGAINNYKLIQALYISAKGADALAARISTKAYRDLYHPENSVVDEIAVNDVRTFIRRMNLMHTQFFQFSLRNDTQREFQRKLELNAISIKYEVKGVVR